MESRRTITGLVKKSKAAMEYEDFNILNVASLDWNYDPLEDDNFVDYR